MKFQSKSTQLNEIHNNNNNNNNDNNNNNNNNNDNIVKKTFIIFRKTLVIFRNSFHSRYKDYISYSLHSFILASYSVFPCVCNANFEKKLPYSMMLNP